MSETKETLIQGGAFLVEDFAGEDIITPEDFTEEHHMIAQTTEDYVTGEVWPVLENLEKQDFEHSVSLLKKAGELGLLSADIQEEYDGLGLDTFSSSLITEKISLPVGFSITHGPHLGIGSLPIVFFGNDDQIKNNLLTLTTGGILD